MARLRLEPRAVAARTRIVIENSPLQELWLAFGERLGRPQHEWEAAVIVLALLVGALLARLVRRRVQARLVDAARDHVAVNLLQFSIEGFRRLAFPAITVLLLRAGEGVLRALHLVGATEPRLLHLAFWLVGALGLVRLFVYALRRALHDSGLVATLERAITATVWLGVALYASGLLGDVVDWLEATRLPMGNATVSLWSVLAGATATLSAALAAMWIGSLIEDRLAEAQGIDTNVRVVTGRVLRALLVVLAVLIALAVSGIDLTVLSVFGGALGVGLGLGLQRIASNYVSGFILLLDNSLRIGDLVTIEKYHGVVARISTRYTLLRGLDGTEAVIPNEMLVSAPVTNHSLTNRRVCTSVRVTIAYGADLELAMRLLAEAAASQPRVLADPAPAALLIEFAPDGLLLEVAFWIADPELGKPGIQSLVALGIHQRFQAHGIEVPAPRRDLRLLGGSAPAAAVGS